MHGGACTRHNFLQKTKQTDEVRTIKRTRGCLQAESSLGCKAHAPRHRRCVHNDPQVPLCLATVKNSVPSCDHDTSRCGRDVKFRQLSPHSVYRFVCAEQDHILHSKQHSQMQEHPSTTISNSLVLRGSALPWCNCLSFLSYFSLPRCSRSQMTRHVQSRCSHFLACLPLGCP